MTHVHCCEPEEEPLDVERLQRAMETSAAALRQAFGDGHVPGWGVVARQVAETYARLSVNEGGHDR